MKEQKFLVDITDLGGNKLTTINMYSYGYVTTTKGRWEFRNEKREERLYLWNRDKWPWWKGDPRKQLFFGPYWMSASVNIYN